ncbi:p24 family protein alpha [Entomortierella parvispora]|uniref:P24 family protein alpha n=1 Tax=Entomortierella parvispora TaxID=205924 RepID=A0A9P3HK36_9FUNG|nr:p24 family protein alpha [Entomortierella parvispora]
MAINVTRWCIGLLMLLSVLPSVFGLYFYLEGSEQKCFSEELPKETIVTGHFTAEEWNEEKKTFAVNYETGIEVVVEEMPAGKRVYAHKLKAKDQFKFTSAESGPHVICLFTTSAGWFSSTKTRVSLDLDIRDILDDAPEPAEGALSELALRVRELNHRVNDIRREQSYLREHEREFRDKSEATNGHTVTWTIVQLVVLAITCAWQMRHLRVFFEARKMI